MRAFGAALARGALCALIVMTLVVLHWPEHRLNERGKAFQTGFRMTFGIYPETRP